MEQTRSKQHDTTLPIVTPLGSLLHSSLPPSVFGGDHLAFQQWRYHQSLGILEPPSNSYNRILDLGLLDKDVGEEREKKKMESHVGRVLGRRNGMSW